VFFLEKMIHSHFNEPLGGLSAYNLLIFMGYDYILAHRTELSESLQHIIETLNEGNRYEILNK
jgi:hypothetical protein